MAVPKRAEAGPRATTPRQQAGRVQGACGETPKRNGSGKGVGNRKGK